MVLFSFDVLFVHFIHLVEFLKPQSELLKLFGLVFLDLLETFGMAVFDRGFEFKKLFLMVEFGLLEKGLGFEKFVFEGGILGLELDFLLVMLIFKFADLLAVLESELTVFFLKPLLSRLSVVLILLVSLKNGLVQLVKFTLLLFVFMKLFFQEVDFLFEERTLTCGKHMA